MSEEDIPDYKVESLLKLYRRFPGLPSSKDYPFFQREIDGFAANAGRLKGLLILPSHFLELGLVAQKVACEASFEASYKRTVDPDSLSNREQFLAQQKLTEKWNALREAGGKRLTKKQQEWRERMLRGHLAVTAGIAQEGYEALLAAIIVNAWTVFEALATDLWITAVNSSPMSLGIMALEARAFERKSGRVPVHPANPKSNQRAARHPIRMDLLLEHRFNLSDKLGTVLHRSRKFALDRHEGIQYAYAVLFGERARTIFKKRYREISLLESIRNLLVHKAGIVDKHFKDDVTKDRILGAAEFGKRLPIDGETVSRFVPPAIAFAKDLILLADGFFKKQNRA